MWGIFLGCVGTAFVIGGFVGLIVWLTWPQENYAIDDGGWLFDEVEDSAWAR